MHTRVIPRLLLVGFMFALIAAGTTTHFKAAAADTADWSNTTSGENQFVHACTGFDITTSYTTNLKYHVVENYTGDKVVERLNVSFAGALANAKNGQSLPYDGRFTRTTDHLGRTTISDLQLRIQLPLPGDWTISLDRVNTNLDPNPVDVIQTVASRQLQSGLCVMLGRWVNTDDLGRPPYGPPSSGTTEWTPQSPAADRPAPCDRPRMDPAYNC
jgi:hypothetical protein